MPRTEHSPLTPSFQVRRCAAATGVAASMLVAAGLLVGCSQSSLRGEGRSAQGSSVAGLARPAPSSADAEASQAADALARLRALAQASRARPSPTPASVRLPSLDASWGVAPPGDATRHRMPLESVLANLNPAQPTMKGPGESGFESKGSEDDDASSGSGVLRSKMLYAQARAKVLAGEPQAAIKDLEGALLLDPDSLVLASELGVLQVRSGQRSAGVRTLRDAVARGLQDAEPLRILARAEHRAGDTPRALELLVLAWNDPSLRDDEAQRWLVQSDLGERLGDEGYLLASHALLSRLSALEPLALAQADLRRPDMGELLRRRGALLLQAGDAAAMADAWEAAQDSYRAVLAGDASQASVASSEGSLLGSFLGSLDAAARLRLAAGSLRAGNPADAAVQLVESLPAPSLPQPWHAEVAGALAQDAEVGRLFALAVRVPVRTEQSAAQATPTGLARRAVLASHALAPLDATPMLQDAIARAGASGASVDGLLSRLLDVVDAGLPSAGGGDGPGQRAVALVEAVSRQPLVAVEASHALVRHGRDLLATQRAIARDASGPARVLASAMALRLDQPQQALDVLGDNAGDAANVGEARQRGMPESLASARVAALRSLGRESQAREVARGFVDGHAGDPWASARVMLVAGDVEGAWGAVAEQVATSGATPGNVGQDDAGGSVGAAAVATRADSLTLDQLVLAARIEQVRGRLRESLALLTRASMLDPDASFLADARLALLRPGQQTADEGRFTSIVRGIRERDPASPLLRRILVGDMAQRQLWLPAINQAMALVDDTGEPSEVADVMVLALQRANDARAQAAAESRWASMLDARPDSPAITSQYARLLVLSGKGQDAERVLADASARVGLEALARQREGVLRDTLKRPEEAQRLMLQRLASKPRTLDNQLELAQALVRTNDFAGARDALASFDERANATTGDAGTIAGPGLLALLRGVRLDALASASPEGQKACLELFDLVQAKGVTLSPDVALVRIDALAIAAPLETPRILRAVEDLATLVAGAPGSGRSIAQARQDATARVAERLFAMEDASPGLRLLEVLALESTPPNDTIGAQWLLTTIVRGDSEDNRRMVLHWRDLEHLLQSLARLGTSPDFHDATSMDEARGEFAYFVANALNSQVREAIAADIYRLCLELDPNHAWASNNFGYMILERGGDLPEAQRLIEQAYEQLSDEASVTDTIGWLRYKQGQLDDVTLPDGTLRPGAVTLLERSLQLAEGGDNWEIHDHMGDALWRRNRAGKDRVRAIEAWRMAQSFVAGDIKLTRVANENAPRLLELVDREKEIAAKLEAASNLQQAGGLQGDAPDVPVAPMGIAPTFTPLPEPPMPTPEPPDPRRPRRPAELLVP